MTKKQFICVMVFACVVPPIAIFALTTLAVQSAEAHDGPDLLKREIDSPYWFNLTPKQQHTRMLLILDERISTLEKKIDGLKPECKSLHWSPEDPVFENNAVVIE